MEELQFWRNKVIQFLHDPPAKPYAGYADTGGHEEVAAELIRRVTGNKAFTRVYNKAPDRSMGGADRPITSPPYRTRGVSPIGFRWPTDPVLTHPLARDARIEMAGDAGTRERGEDEIDAHIELAYLAGDDDGSIAGSDHRHAHLADESEAVDTLQDLWPGYEDPAKVRRGFLVLWRRLRAALMENAGSDLHRLLWREMPPESRCPDHSIWDHNRVTSALAFLSRRNEEATHPTAPWLLRFEIGPVGRFIGEARSGRDLWMGSFLLADLAWHAMQPLVERYGPDCILYPDLCANPRADVWLADTCLEALGSTGSKDSDLGPSSFAAVLPNTFVALLPRGGEGHLAPLDEMARQAQASLARRWTDLAGIVEDWVVKRRGPGPWQATWQRQHRNPPLAGTWSAVAWRPGESLENAESLLGDPLPTQAPRQTRDPIPAADLEALRTRKARLAPWMPESVWTHYHQAKTVSARTNLTLHQCGRGFDYALTHHQLRLRQALRGQEASEPALAGEAGEKCTQCGRRQALYDPPAADRLQGHRAAARAFWQDEALSPEGDGRERLCGVCALKRFLVEAGAEGDRLTGINPLWAGARARVRDVTENDDTVRVPFPSTATLAAQDWLERVCGDPSLHAHLAAVTRAWNRTGLPRTGFAHALYRLGHLSTNGPIEVRDFLMLDTQQSLFPETLDLAIREAHKKGEGSLAQALEHLKAQVQALREAAPGRPGTRIAVLRLDGDSMGRLLLGDPEVITARWRDVIHPRVVEQLRTNPTTVEAGWPALLERPRLMGPALHAFVSRALGEFAHRIVPWVVEREYSGRLVYAGGDDILALAPADDALELAARLAQLFSAPWVLDTRPDQTAWDWRLPNRPEREHLGRIAARRRFLVPRTDRGPIRLPIRDPALLVPHVGETTPEPPPAGPADLIPLLGPGHSLSAGIVYAHYKTDLGLLLEQAKTLLRERAKGWAGRAAVALAHRSRNGVKSSFTLKWRGAGPELDAHRRLGRVIVAFAEGELPGRLPYKLREQARILAGLDTKDQDDETLINGLFREALGKEPETPVEQDALALWREGLVQCARQESIDEVRQFGVDAELVGFSEKVRRSDGNTPPEQGGVDALLLARALATPEEEA